MCIGIQEGQQIIYEKTHKEKREFEISQKFYKEEIIYSREYLHPYVSH